MKIIMSSLLIAIIVLSCKKESKTETHVTTDTVIADTIRTDSVSPVSPIASDTIHRDTVSSKKLTDTTGAHQNKIPKK
ncbi:hypothetical protein J2795_001503 [Chryseobacterium bernardetii]|uniref:Uncharacterized protein n=3 Tax=Chryseobacterium TaxID=59732 RepID=A0A543EIW2_9FLAO|nr:MULTISPECIES: hypothetical protein [Chryseobacterium]MDR6369954.1 hypothetical protein [Chryseobacterium vietnamense]MDR6440803.1 hypothetical protein [Chryseobacterium bernardetii]MDR6457982.1 hypothetical protein [Chryseobacterium vietnamense]TQM21518.1 hypothetical protein FB551_1207 [Chryseobacterium aquifrigidense]